MRLLGRLAFWMAWPGLWLALRWSRRTRVLIVVEDEFLVARNWFGSGQWGLVGGGLHRGESPADGARREVYEELGVLIEPGQLQTTGECVSRTHGFRYKYYRFVVVLPARPQLRLQALEISDVQWIDHYTMPASGLDREAVTAVSDWWQ